jgi:hypothetical protein
MIGSEAGEAMAAIQNAMLAELPYCRLRDAVIAHQAETQRQARNPFAERRWW